MTELIIFGPAILGAAAVVVLGRRLLARAGVAGRTATVTAALAGAAAAATWLVFIIDAIFHSLGENGPEYYEFSTYMEYRELANGPSFLAIALGYASVSVGLTLCAAIVWRQIHPSAGLVVAVGACVAVLLPAIVPSRLSRVEYGKDPVLYTDDQAAGRVESILGRPMVCIAYGVQGLYVRGSVDPVPPKEHLCIPVHERAIRTSHLGVRYYDVTAFHRVVDELNESGVEPKDSLPDVDVEGLEPSRAVWTAS